MLEDLIIDRTEYTPSISFSVNAKDFMIVGEARPENAGKFFEPVLLWLKNFSETAHNDESFKQNKSVKVYFILDYFNSSSIKYLYDVLKQLEFIKPYLFSLEIVWSHESSDEDMYENGVEFSKIIDVPFIFEKR
ncbi:MAG: DUF1987 family protein [Bacteroidia bacterium]|nr:DUF1987 family protein [Bacteroidia bacterium]